MMQTLLTWTCVCCARHTVVYRILNFMKKSEQGPWYSGVLISATLRLNFHYGSYPPFSCTDLQSTATVRHIISFYPVWKHAKWRWNPSNFRERLLVFNFLKLGGTPVAFIVHMHSVYGLRTIQECTNRVLSHSSNFDYLLPGSVRGQILGSNRHGKT